MRKIPFVWYCLALAFTLLLCTTKLYDLTYELYDNVYLLNAKQELNPTTANRKVV